MPRGKQTDKEVPAAEPAPEQEIETIIEAPATLVMPPEVADYVKQLHGALDERDERIQQLETEREAATPAEVKDKDESIIWAELFGLRTYGDRTYPITIDCFRVAASSPERAWDLWIRGLKYVEEEFHLKLAKVPLPASSPAPTSANNGDAAPSAGPPSRATQAAPARTNAPRRTAPSEQESTPGEPVQDKPIWIPVTSLQLAYTKSGDPLLYVKTSAPGFGRFKRYGIPAYLDSCQLPDDVKAMIDSGEWKPMQTIEGGLLQKDFGDMVRAHYNPVDQKIMGFSD